jgi:hypothetical protein
MSIPAISANALFQSLRLQNWSKNQTAANSRFDPLAQNSESRNSAQSQSDFSSALRNAGANSAALISFGQDLAALGQSLQAGNVNAAQQAYAAAEQDAQQISSTPHQHGHHHHRGPAAAGATDTDKLATDFTSLGQALQNANLTAAQKAYATFQLDVQQLNLAGGAQSVGQ